MLLDIAFHIGSSQRKSLLCTEGCVFGGRIEDLCLKVMCCVSSWVSELPPGASEAGWCGAAKLLPEESS